MFGKRHLISQDVCKGGIAIFALERRGPEQHLIYQYSKRPPVHCRRVAAPLDDFRGNILLSPHKRIGSEIRDTRFRIDCGKRIGGSAIAPKNHGRSSARV